MTVTEIEKINVDGWVLQSGCEVYGSAERTVDVASRTVYGGSRYDPEEVEEQYEFNDWYVDALVYVAEDVERELTDSEHNELCNMLNERSEYANYYE